MDSDEERRERGKGKGKGTRTASSAAAGTRVSPKTVERTKALLSDEQALVLLTKRAFRKADKNKNGALDLDEVREAADSVCVQAKIPPFTQKEFKEFYAELDLDGNGTIDRKEFHGLVKMALEAGVVLSGESSDL